MDDTKDCVVNKIGPCRWQSQSQLLVVLAQSTARLAKDLQKGPASETQAAELQAVAASLAQTDEQCAGPCCCMTMEEVERTVRRTMSAAGLPSTGISANKGAFPKANAPLYVRVEDFRHDLNQMLTNSAKHRGDLDQLQQQCRRQKEALDEALAAIALLRSESRGVNEFVVAHDVSLKHEHSSRRDLEADLRCINERVDSLNKALQASTTDVVGLREVLAGLGNQSKSDVRHLDRHIEQGQRSVEVRLATLQSEMSKNASMTYERFGKLEELCITEHANLKRRLAEAGGMLTQLNDRLDDNTAKLREVVDEAETRCLKRLEEQGSSLTNLINTEMKVHVQKQQRDTEGLQRLVNGVEAAMRASKNEVELSRGNDNASMDKRCREVERTLHDLKGAYKKCDETLREEMVAWTKTQLEETVAKFGSAMENITAVTTGSSQFIAGLEKKLETAQESVQHRIDNHYAEQQKSQKEWEHWRKETAASLRSLEVEKDRAWSLSLEIQAGLEVLTQGTAASLDKVRMHLQNQQDVSTERFKNLELVVEQKVSGASVTLRKAFGEDLKAANSEHQGVQRDLQVQNTTLQNELRALQDTLNVEKDASVRRSLQDNKRFANLLQATSDQLDKSLAAHEVGSRAEHGQLRQTLESLMGTHEEKARSSLAALSEQVTWLSGALERGEADAARRHEQTHSALSTVTALASSAKEEAVSAMQRAAASESVTRGALSQRDTEIRSLVEGLARLRGAAAH